VNRVDKQPFSFWGVKCWGKLILQHLKFNFSSIWAKFWPFWIAYYRLFYFRTEYWCELFISNISFWGPRACWYDQIFTNPFSLNHSVIHNKESLYVLNIEAHIQRSSLAIMRTRVPTSQYQLIYLPQLKFHVVLSVPYLPFHLFTYILCIKHNFNQLPQLEYYLVIPIAVYLSIDFWSAACWQVRWCKGVWFVINQENVLEKPMIKLRLVRLLTLGTWNACAGGTRGWYHSLGITQRSLGLRLRGCLLRRHYHWSSIGTRRVGQNLYH